MVGSDDWFSMCRSGSFLHRAQAPSSSFFALLSLRNRQPMIIMIDQPDARCRSLDRDLVHGPLPPFTAQANAITTAFTTVTDVLPTILDLAACSSASPACGVCGSCMIWKLIRGSWMIWWRGSRAWRRKGDTKSRQYVKPSNLYSTRVSRSVAIRSCSSVDVSNYWDRRCLRLRPSTWPIANRMNNHIVGSQRAAILLVSRIVSLCSFDSSNARPLMMHNPPNCRDTSDESCFVYTPGLVQFCY